jgi:hypothetical protein
MACIVGYLKHKYRLCVYVKEMQDSRVIFAKR